MARREDVLEEIVATALAHDLTSAEVAAALEHARGRASGPAASGLVARMLAYLGGTFVFAGLATFVTLNWDAMNAAARIVATLGAGVAVFAIAIVPAQTERLVRARAPLLLIAAALQAAGILVALDELSTGGDWRYAVLLMTLVMAVQQALAFSRLKATTLALTTLVFATGAVTVTLDIAGMSGDLNAVVTGAALVLVALGLARGAQRAVAPLAYLAGAPAFLVGGFELVRDTRVELAFMLAACGCVVLSVHARSRVLLAVGTIAMLGYIAYFTEQRFVDSLGWPLVLVLLGVVLIGISAAALGLDRRYIDASR